MASSPKDVYIPLMGSDSDDIELSGNRENEFISDLYGDVIEISKRTREAGIYLRDFLFDMFHVTTDNRTFWWMHMHHPVAIMLMDNHCEPVDVVKSRTGTAVVYDDNQVRSCLDSLEAMCKRHGLTIIAEEKE